MRWLNLEVGIGVDIEVGLDVWRWKIYGGLRQLQSFWSLIGSWVVPAFFGRSCKYKVEGALNN
jgi:hypothetical protein